MLYWTVNVMFAFLISVIFAGVLIPQILLVAFRKQLFDVPDGRKIHSGVVPRLGGIAFKPVIFFSVMFVLGTNLVFGYNDVSIALQNNIMQISAGGCAVIILYLVGMSDDLIGVRYRAKFFVQIMCGLLLVFSGVWIENLYGILGIYEVPPVVGYPLTILVTVFIINAINLIDGIDGLASGLCGVVLLFYGVVFLARGEYMYSLISFATLGTIVPFFYYNVFGDNKNGRKIFMGDTGSLTLGMILSFLCIEMIVHGTIEETNSAILAFIPLMIPCLDVVRVFIHRVRDKTNPFKPDRNHIHHKLLKAGLNQRTVMALIIVFAILFIVCNLYLSYFININILIIGDMLTFAGLNVWLTQKIKKRGL